MRVRLSLPSVFKWAWSGPQSEISVPANGISNFKDFQVESERQTLAYQSCVKHSSQLNYQQLEILDRYLDTVEGNKKNLWAITIQIQDKPITIKVDTGAKVLIAGERIAGSFLLGVVLATESSEVSSLAGCFNACFCSFTASC